MLLLTHGIGIPALVGADSTGDASLSVTAIAQIVIEWARISHPSASRAKYAECALTWEFAGAYSREPTNAR